MKKNIITEKEQYIPGIIMSRDDHNDFPSIYIGRDRKLSTGMKKNLLGGMNIYAMDNNAFSKISSMYKSFHNGRDNEGYAGFSNNEIANVIGSIMMQLDNINNSSSREDRDLDIKIIYPRNKSFTQLVKELYKDIAEGKKSFLDIREVDVQVVSSNRSTSETKVKNLKNLKENFFNLLELSVLSLISTNPGMADESEINNIIISNLSKSEDIQDEPLVFQNIRLLILHNLFSFSNKDKIRKESFSTLSKEIDKLAKEDRRFAICKGEEKDSVNFDRYMILLSEKNYLDNLRKLNNSKSIDNSICVKEAISFSYFSLLTQIMKTAVESFDEKTLAIGLESISKVVSILEKEINSKKK